NFVVFDTQLDTFRFAHLSVREFLEKRLEYNRTATNASAAEACLLHLLSITPNPATRVFLSRFSQCQMMDSFKLPGFSQYSNVYWAAHCQMAGEERTSGKLKSTF